MVADPLGGSAKIQYGYSRDLIDTAVRFQNRGGEPAPALKSKKCISTSPVCLRFGGEPNRVELSSVEHTPREHAVLRRRSDGFRDPRRGDGRGSQSSTGRSRGRAGKVQEEGAEQAKTDRGICSA